MKQKNGFTLVEVLEVIGILGVIMTISATAVIGIIKNSDKKLKNEMENNLKDAAVAYMEEKKIYLRKCSTDFDPENPNASDVNCYQAITVQELIDSGLFTDDSKYCNREESILIYRATETEYTEFRAYVKEGTCK